MGQRAGMLQRILLPTDLSHHAEVGVRFGVELARRFGASVTVAHVWDPAMVREPLAPLLDGAEDQEALLADAREELDRELERWRLRLPADVSAERALIEGREASEAIVEEAGNGYDLIVLSTHGRTGLRRFLVGSVAERVARSSPVDVVTIPVFTD